MNLAFLKERCADCPRVMVVSPHPDDEVIGAGSRLPLLRNALIIQVTDGSPQELQDARAAGCCDRAEYAGLRQSEIWRALELCGIDELIELGIPDQQASLHLPELSRNLRELILRFAPDVILTVPYEGGHPDHDSTAFAVHLACEHLDKWQRPAIVEMLSYHNQEGRCEMTMFLNEAADSVLEIELDEKERAFKQQLFDCFESQQRVLRWFPLEREKFRLAPRYDFTRPPRNGQLYYEMFPWGMSSRYWNELAKAALGELRPQIEYYLT